MPTRAGVANELQMIEMDHGMAGALCVVSGHGVCGLAFSFAVGSHRMLYQASP